MDKKCAAYLIKEATRPYARGSSGGRVIPVPGMQEAVAAATRQGIGRKTPPAGGGGGGGGFLAPFRRMGWRRGLRAAGIGGGIGALLWGLGHLWANKNRPSVSENVTQNLNARMRGAGEEGIYMKPQ